LAEDQSGTLSQLRDQVEAGFKAVARSESDIAAILYTSGTTGRSKGAMMSHAALATNAETLKDYWHFTESDVLIHGLPIFHAHGLFVAVNVTFMAGSQILFMPKFDAEHVIDLMPKATTFMGVPTHYTRLLAQPGLTNAAAGLRLCVSGSAPLSSETFKTWKAATGKAILERYGMTETNMNTSNPYEGERRAGAVGFPLPGVELKICDSKSGKELAPGETGTIEIRGPNLFSGYWRMPEKTAMEMRQDGWLITGDLGKVDADGYVHIVGRSKDLIISGGYNIYPKEVEVVLDATASVQESAVIGVPHPDFGEGVVAIVVPKMGQTPNLRSVMDEIEGKLARFKLPKRMVLADELPRNTMGKVQKNVLRERYSELLTTGSAN
jgi:malonyl-CoA/methylmalonyl-CoA synthetase